MSRLFDQLLDEIRVAHQTLPALIGFTSFPDDLREITLTPRLLPAARHMTDQLSSRDAEMPLARAFYAAWPDAYWRETYDEATAGADFMERFGCYCVVGEGGQWISDKFACYVVTMPPRLHYPWHHHPAEELYVVLSGEATFLRAGDEPETLRAGDASFHASNRPHAMTTGDGPVMAYVVWRNHLDIGPELTPPEGLDGYRSRPLEGQL